jgi:hypothetical protein
MKMNANDDNTPIDQIKPPPRMSEQDWDKYEEDIKKGKKK